MPKNAPKPGSRFYSTSAWLYFLIGFALISMPYLVAHNGYNESIFVASPEVTSPFDRTLIFIGQHSVDSSIGIILNKPLSASDHAKLSPFIRDSGLPIAYGGPIDVSDRLFVLEEIPPGAAGNKETVFDLTLWDDAVRQNPDLLDTIRASIKNGERKYRLFTGYAVWGPFQLEYEVVIKHFWRIMESTHDMIFQENDASHWDTIEKKRSDEVQKKNPNQT